MSQLILASSSIHRARLLEEYGYTFRTKPHKIREVLDPTIPVGKLICQLAAQKAHSVFPVDGVVLAADTIVIDRSGKLLSKVHTPSEARVHLENRSNSHEIVVTGICLMDDSLFKLEAHRSKIEYLPIPRDIIEEIIESNEWKGVCGGLKVEGLVAPYIKKVYGSINNIKGLPVEMLRPRLSSFLWQSPHNFI